MSTSDFAVEVQYFAVLHIVSLNFHRKKAIPAKSGIAFSVKPYYLSLPAAAEAAASSSYSSISSGFIGSSSSTSSK